MDVHDIEEYGFPPLSGLVFTALAAPGFLPRLRSLNVTIAWADPPALRAFAESELVAQLDALYVEVRFPGTDDYECIIESEKQRPDAIRLAIESFLARHE